MPDDNGIRAALADSSEWAERDAQLPGAAEARQRARTRSVAATTAAAVLTVLAVSATVIGVSRFDPDGPALPAPAASAPPTPSSAATGTRRVPTTIPDDFSLGATQPTGSDYRVETLHRLSVGVCTGDALPGIETATAQTYRRVIGPEHVDILGVAVFADADAAMSFMTGLLAAAAECNRGAPRPEGGSREVVQEPLRGTWASGLTTLMIDIPAADLPQRVGGSYLFAMRIGSAVALNFDAGEVLFHSRPYTIDPLHVDEGRLALEDLAPRMCRWTVAGC